MAQAKRYCGVSDSTLMRLINANILPAEQVAPFAPYEIKQSDLDNEPVLTMGAALLERRSTSKKQWVSREVLRRN
jgi:hypothetical protein